MSLFESLSLCWIRLALRGVWEGHLTAKHLPVERGESICRLGVNQTEKLQFVNVEVANRLHYGKLRHHLRAKEREEEKKVGKGERKNWVNVFAHRYPVKIKQKLSVSVPTIAGWGGKLCSVAIIYFEKCKVYGPCHGEAFVQWFQV